MRRIFSFLALFLSIVAMASIAFAADTVASVATTGGTTTPQEFAAFLKATLFPVIGSMFLGILGVFVNRFGAKFKIEALTQKDNFLTQLAYQGVTMAEEKAAQLVGSKASLTGNQKLDLAVSHILSIMPTLSPERARAIVEATLAQIPGIGATGDQAFSISPILSAFTAPMSATSLSGVSGQPPIA